MTELKNPALPGDFLLDTVIYASAGSNYGSVPALVQYTIYDSPNPAFVTPRINIAPFAQSRISAVAFSQHERAAQRTHLHPARAWPVPVDDVRARQPRTARELDARLSLSVLSCWPRTA